MTRLIEIAAPENRNAETIEAIDLSPIASLLDAIGVSLHGGRILQLGTRGCFGVGELLETYKPARIVAYQMNMAPSLKVSRLDEEPFGQDAYIPEPDDAFHAVFAYGMLDVRTHWRPALLEIARVLKTRGALIVQGFGPMEPTSSAFAELMPLLRRAGLALAVNKQLLGGALHVVIARRITLG